MVTKYPPQLNLSEALAVVKEMYARHNAREISVDLMPEILKTKKNSSFFPAKISALQKFGLLQKQPNGLLFVTDEAMKIVHPIGDGESFDARLTAFGKVDILSDLLLKYPNGKLPSAEALQQNLMKTFGIDRSNVKAWYEFVVDSFRAIPELSSKTVYPAPVPFQEEGSLPPAKSLAKSISQSGLPFRIPLPSGKTFEYSLEEGLTQGDLDFLKTFFDLLKSTTK